MTQEIKNGEKVFGFDLDGVIVDHTELKQKLAAKYGFKLEPSQTHSYVMRQYLPADINKKIQHEIYAQYSSQPLFPGAKRFFKKLKETDIPFFLISRRKGDGGREMATAILKVQGLWPEFFNERNTFFVDSPEEKNEKAKELGVTYYVDDEKMVLEIMKDVPHRFLFDSFDNFKNELDFKRLRDWDQLSKALGI